ncbi:hypothetical protein PybrP1_003953 [[Pythium] brassicae (nom. inval.)]|nr:hypothetical protein PybrP1_003953 [[Pythium] brassicae (nom. inval.)]
MRRSTRSAAAAAASTSSASASSPRATSTARKRAAAASEATAAPDAAPSSPKRAKAAASADAWGALFAASKRAATSRVQLRPASLLSAELQARVDAAAATFDGIEKKRSDRGTRVAAWNVNGLRALLRNDDSVHLRAYVAREDPDVLCLSETKVDRDELQKLENLWPQYEHQYWACATKKGYAGTAVLSKVKPLSVRDEIVASGNKAPDDEGRFLALEFAAFWLVHTYVPNAGMKLERLDYRTKKWDVAMVQLLQELEKTKPVVWCGDLNVAHQEIDIHDPKTNRNKSPGFTDAERKSFGAMLASGFVDTFRALHPETQQFSYYSYRFNARAKNKGWRIDYFVVSQALLAKVEASEIRSAVTGSDHVPIVLDLNEPL